MQRPPERRRRGSDRAQSRVRRSQHGRPSDCDAPWRDRGRNPNRGARADCLEQELSPVGMKQTLDVINRMEADGIIGRYAIAGAVAAYNYIEPAVTNDLDILLSFEEPAAQQKTGLVSLEPIFTYLKTKGYEQHSKEGIVIEGWPVQFLPVANQ